MTKNTGAFKVVTIEDVVPGYKDEIVYIGDDEEMQGETCRVLASSWGLNPGIYTSSERNPFIPRDEFDKWAVQLANKEESEEVEKGEEIKMKDVKEIIMHTKEFLESLEALEKRMKGTVALSGRISVEHSNENRLKLITEAKKYVKEGLGRVNESSTEIAIKVSREDRQVRVASLRIIDGRTFATSAAKYSYPSLLVWNKHIVKAWGLAKYFLDKEAENKYGLDAVQPTEFVEGMHITAILNETVYEGTKTVVHEIGQGMADAANGQATSIYRGFRIVSDTKAVYR